MADDANHECAACGQPIKLPIGQDGYPGICVMDCSDPAKARLRFVHDWKCLRQLIEIELALESMQ